MIPNDALDRGRESFGRGAWGDAYALLSEADHDGAIGIEDLERLATAAHLVGRDDDSVDVWAWAHHACLRLGEVPRAVRCAFWLTFGLLNRGEVVQAGGWLARARRLLDDGRSARERSSDTRRLLRRRPRGWACPAVASGCGR